MTATSQHWWSRLHPAIITGSFAGFLVFGGFWNWVFCDATNTFIAASIFAGVLLVPTLLCLAVSKNTRVGFIGVWLAVVSCLAICGIYFWRAYLAYFEQQNVGKTLLILIGIVAGLLSAGLLVINRSYGQKHAEPSDPPNDGPATSVDNSNASGGGRHR